MRLEQENEQAARACWERRFCLWVYTGVIATGLGFTAAHVPGGEQIVLGGGSLLAGHSIVSKLKIAKPGVTTQD